MSLHLSEGGGEIAASKIKAYSAPSVDKTDLKREAMLSVWQC